MRVYKTWWLPWVVNKTNDHDKNVISSLGHLKIKKNYAYFIPPLLSEHLKMGGGGHFKIQKKKPNFGGDTHVKP